MTPSEKGQPEETSIPAVDAAERPGHSTSSAVAPVAGGYPAPEGRAASDALAEARAGIAAADAVAATDPGEAFRRYADAYAALGGFPSDAACRELAATIVPKLRKASSRANAGVDATDDDTTLIEE